MKVIARKYLDSSDSGLRISFILPEGECNFIISKQQSIELSNEINSIISPTRYAEISKLQDEQVQKFKELEERNAELTKENEDTKKALNEILEIHRNLQRRFDNLQHDIKNIVVQLRTD